MTTKRIYQTDRYAKNCKAIITDVLEQNGYELIACDQSVFFPEGGGQPSDVGTVVLVNEYADSNAEFTISHASDKSLETEVWHHTDAPSGTFKPGDEVVLTIDWPNRFRNMQRHLGEHMLSGTMHTLFGGVNRGFHMGNGYITIDIDLDGRMLTDEDLERAEKTVNDAIWADLPVTISWFDSYEESLVMPVRKQVPHDGRVSVVTVGDFANPYDCIACCGTHPSRSSEVGLLAIYKCEPNKGMNRIFFDCGIFAKERLSQDFRILADVSKRYSCSPSDIIGRLDAEADKISALNAKVSGLTAYVKEAEKKSILEEISSFTASVYKYSSDILSADDLLKLGFSIVEELSESDQDKPEIIAFMAPALSTIILFSTGDAKCGKIIKENASKFGGKGGGRDDNARALFSNAHDMKNFANALHEML